MPEPTVHSSGLIARNTLMLYIRMLLVMGVSLYTSRIVLDRLGVVDYGIFNVVGGVVVMLSFLNGAMGQSSQRFLSYELGRKDIDKLTRTFSTSVTIHLLIAVVILVLAETVGLWFLNREMTIPRSQMSGANWVYQCAVVSLIISIVQVPYTAAIIARERMKIYAYIGILEVCMKLGVAFSLSLFPGDKLKFYALLILLSGVVSNLVNILYCRRYFDECGRVRVQFDKELFRPMVRFASWSMYGALAWVGRSQGCNLILNLFFGPVVNAAYGISGQVNEAVNRFVRSFATAVNPQIVKTYSAGEYDSMQSLMTYGAKLSFFLLLILSFPVLLVTDKLLNIWLVDVPEYAVIFTRLIILNSLVESFSYSMSVGIQSTGKIKRYQILVGSTVLLNMPVSYILLRFGYAPTVVFITNICLSCVTVIERLSLMKRLIPEFSVWSFVRVVFIPSLIVGMVCIGLYILYNILGLTDRINIFVTMILSLVTAILIEFSLGLDSGERRLVCDWIRSKILRV